MCTISALTPQRVEALSPRIRAIHTTDKTKVFMIQCADISTDGAGPDRTLVKGERVMLRVCCANPMMSTGDRGAQRSAAPRCAALQKKSTERGSMGMPPRRFFSAFHFSIQRAILARLFGLPTLTVAMMRL